MEKQNLKSTTEVTAGPVSVFGVFAQAWKKSFETRLIENQVVGRAEEGDRSKNVLAAIRAFFLIADDFSPCCEAGDDDNLYPGYGDSYIADQHMFMMQAFGLRPGFVTEWIEYAALAYGEHTDHSYSAFTFRNRSKLNQVTDFCNYGKAYDMPQSITLRQGVRVDAVRDCNPHHPVSPPVRDSVLVSHYLTIDHFDEWRKTFKNVLDFDIGFEPLSNSVWERFPKNGFVSRASEFHHASPEDGSKGCDKHTRQCLDHSHTVYTLNEPVFVYEYLDFYDFFDFIKVGSDHIGHVKRDGEVVADFKKESHDFKHLQARMYYNHIRQVERNVRSVTRFAERFEKDQLIEDSYYVVPSLVLPVRARYTRQLDHGIQGEDLEYRNQEYIFYYHFPKYRWFQPRILQFLQVLLGSSTFGKLCADLHPVGVVPLDKHRHQKVDKPENTKIRYNFL